MAYGEILGGGATRRSGVLIVDSDVLVRQPLAEYLRECGYRVIEADGVCSARKVLDGGGGELPPVDVVLSDAELADGSGFALRAWLKERRPELKVFLAGNVAAAARVAGELCEEGPHLARPYDPQLVIERIKRMTANRVG
jgi:DNA-binding NtrC family response regulator